MNQRRADRLAAVRAKTRAYIAGPRGARPKTAEDRYAFVQAARIDALRAHVRAIADIAEALAWTPEAIIDALREVK